MARRPLEQNYQVNENTPSMHANQRKTFDSDSILKWCRSLGTVPLINRSSVAMVANNRPTDDDREIGSRMNQSFILHNFE